ncbi:hypothetical protein [Streptomyces sp. NPDC059874]
MRKSRMPVLSPRPAFSFGSKEKAGGVPTRRIATANSSEPPVRCDGQDSA